MKRFLVITVAGLFLTCRFFGQTAADSVLYNTGINLVNKAKTTDNYLEAAFYFEQVAAQYPKQWLAAYYAALAYIQASQKSLVSKDKDVLMDRAQPLIDKASALTTHEPELYVLQAFLYQSRLQVNPELRGMSYAPKADALLKKAMAADPAIPRAYFLLGCNVYYTPVFFKGGAKNALPLFLQAKEKYRAYVPALPFMPTWGERENQDMIKMCKQSK
jgi:hypothetical protein